MGSSTRYDGFATMYMRMPMSTSALPIQGQCLVEDRRITLRFPFTGIEFELPSPPSTISASYPQQMQQIGSSGAADDAGTKTALKSAELCERCD
jgi:hypothetical protein